MMKDLLRVGGNAGLDGLQDLFFFFFSFSTTAAATATTTTLILKGAKLVEQEQRRLIDRAPFLLLLFASGERKKEKKKKKRGLYSSSSFSPPLALNAHSTYAESERCSSAALWDTLQGALRFEAIFLVSLVSRLCTSMCPLN